MKTRNLTLLVVLTLSFMFTTSGVLAQNSGNGNGSSQSTPTQSSSTNSSGSASPSPTSSANGATQVQNQNSVQNRTANPGLGTMTESQIEVKIQSEIQQSKSVYSPKNSNATARADNVANAAEALIRVSNKVENQGIGDQIRIIAQTQTRNQDKINQSMDKAEARNSFAKFFIGANYKELKTAREAATENQLKIKELQNLLEQVATDADKLTIANQITVLYEESLNLNEQIRLADHSFSLFGWVSRIISNY